MTSEATPDIDTAVQLAIQIARLGEADCRNWWGSRAFGAAGRVVLKQRLPRTWRMAAVELDLASATIRHNEIMSRSNAVHMFSDRWPLRRWTSAWVAEQKTEETPHEIFELLESTTTDTIESHLQTYASAAPENLGDAIRVGTIRRSSLSDPSAVLGSTRALAATYVGLEVFAVPFIEVVG